MLRSAINNLLGTIPVVGKYFPTFRPGHYYSPIVDKRELNGNVFAKPQAIEGIDLNLAEQFEILAKLNHYEPNFKRYKQDNPMFPLTDAHVTAFMMDYIRPRVLFEVGCGYSSAAILDGLRARCECFFVDPEPRRFRGLIQDHFIYKKKIQDVPLHHFKYTDVLFVDSSHVSKTGSDVNHILFNILPQLKRGCGIHFHDIFYPFEYPEYWVKEFYRGFGWNEAYLLRAFLTSNKQYKIVYWDSCMRHFFPDKIDYGKADGGSIWIQKL